MMGTLRCGCPCRPACNHPLSKRNPRRSFIRRDVGFRGWVGIELARISDEDLKFHIQVAWERIAPKKLVTELNKKSEARGKRMKKAD